MNVVESMLEQKREFEESSWLNLMDRLSDSLSDRLNPILVKETRQSLKSRQFVITFFTLLFAALGWTVVGSLSKMPQIYTVPSAPAMLIGYYVVLAVPMLLIVPLAAYRSLEVEIDDGTLELLTISALNPWQIVLGKLASALMQLLLYFVALLPCVSFAYTLRGVELTVIFLMTSGLLFSGVLLTIVALFFAPLTHSRSGRICTLLATLMILLASEAGLAYLVLKLVSGGNPLNGSELFLLLLSVLVLGFSLGNLLLTVTAAQLTPASENRSTRIRLAIFILSTSLIFVSLLVFLVEQIWSSSVFFAIQAAAWLLWTFCGAMLVSESSIETPRVRRDLPSSFLGRSFLTWLMPGPVTGLVFVTINMGILLASLEFVHQWEESQVVSLGIFGWTKLGAFSDLCYAFAAYLLGTLVVVHWVVRWIRKIQQPRIEFGIAVMVVVVLFSALAPYSVGLHWNDYNAYEYSLWQMTNWAWTLVLILGRGKVGWSVFWITTLAILGLVFTLQRSTELFQPRKLATPKRVQEELGQ
jgi:hypothetical protein